MNTKSLLPSEPIFVNRDNQANIIAIKKRKAASTLRNYGGGVLVSQKRGGGAAALNSNWCNTEESGESTKLRNQKD
jgi:hypothetical protein